MAFTQNLVKLSWGGLIDGLDIWTNSVHLRLKEGSVASAFPISDDDLAKRFFDAIKPAYLNGDHAMCSFNTLQWAKVAVIGTDGKYLRDAGQHYEAGDGLKSNAGANNRTPSDSIVVSLLTDKQRGRGHRGRIYPPAFSIATDQQGFVNAGNIGDYVDSFKTMIGAINSVTTAQIDIPDLPGVDTGDFEVVVASKIGSGVTEKVTAIEVGSVFDVQRRRRNRLPEVYTKQNI